MPSPVSAAPIAGWASLLSLAMAANSSSSSFTYPPTTEISPCCAATTIPGCNYGRVGASLGVIVVVVFAFFCGCRLTCDQAWEAGHTAGMVEVLLKHQLQKQQPQQQQQTQQLTPAPAPVPAAEPETEPKIAPAAAPVPVPASASEPEALLVQVTHEPVQRGFAYGLGILMSSIAPKVVQEFARGVFEKD
ncbi:hypothetical protein BKA67DRAFT_541207 [Truncatella angustata]|uniref:Uncharacterized protein n=1 Tax=Truncatella angustata TaxID=152316 RepID=A0A9P8RMN9_9PEZI|nr:uncharacterized protein BKA67DRAFT_541207 [Truncatella angustata]KAH6646230.1 hypothetical protein BKA67DRAFT_541207 [Truncatella angustata]